MRHLVLPSKGDTRPRRFKPAVAARRVKFIGALVDSVSMLTRGDRAEW